MADDNTPSVFALLVMLAVVVFGGLALHVALVEHGHCVPTWRPGADADCFLFLDDRLDAVTAFAAAAGSMGALVWLRRRGEVHRPLEWGLGVLCVLGLAVGSYVLATR